MAEYICQWKGISINSRIKYSRALKMSRTLRSFICQLCLTEKLWIIKFITNKYLLNKKSEVIDKYRQMNQFLSANIKKYVILFQLHCLSCIIVVNVNYICLYRFFDK